MEIEENTSKRILSADADGKLSVGIFACTILLIVGITFSMWGIKLITSYPVKYMLVLLTIVAYTAVAVVTIFLTKQQHILKPTRQKLWLQILLGFAIAAVLCFFIGILPILCGTNFIGSHTEASASKIILSALQDILFVGVGEEIVFRGYIQNQFNVWLKKCKWLAPLIAAVFFGVWHIINGSIFQVLFATLIGSVLGYAKYFIKDCSLLSVIIAHGLYDFSLVLLTCFMI